MNKLILTLALLLPFSTLLANTVDIKYPNESIEVCAVDGLNVKIDGERKTYYPPTPEYAVCVDGTGYVYIKLISEM